MALVTAGRRQVEKHAMPTLGGDAAMQKGLPRRLGAFLEAAHPHLERSVPRISALRLGRVLSKIDGPLASSRQGGAFLNVWSVAGLKNNEVRNSAVLAWFIDPHGSHGLQDAFAVQLMARLKPRPSWLEARETLRSIAVTVEERPIASTENRVDITVAGPDFIIYIEVKILASEGVRQLDRYQEDLLRTAKAQGKAHTCIALLTRTGKASASGVDVSTLSWRDVQLSAGLVARKLALGDHRRMLLEQFSMHIDSF